MRSPIVFTFSNSSIYAVIELLKVRENHAHPYQKETFSRSIGAGQSVCEKNETNFTTKKCKPHTYPPASSKASRRSQSLFPSICRRVAAPSPVGPAPTTRMPTFSLSEDVAQVLHVYSTHSPHSLSKKILIFLL